MDSMKNQQALSLYICNLPELREDIRPIKSKDLPILLASYPDEDNNGSPDIDSTRPLIWYNNEENKDQENCIFCFSQLDGTAGYYMCNIFNKYTIGIHKECIEPMTKNLYHPKHSLQSLIFWCMRIGSCYCCFRVKRNAYYCSICNFSICRDCAKKPPLLAIDHPKIHEHTLFYVPREASMTCDICASNHRTHFFFDCRQCDFVVHKECIYLPRVIKISRHKHRLSFTYSYLPGKWFCGVCRKKFDENYGGYSCVKGCSYVVHSKCVKLYDVWDGIELEGVPEDSYEDISPFKEINDGIIQHFSHEHHMRLEENIDKVFEEYKCCQACTLSVYGGDIFSCMECDFVLHKVCAYLPLKKQHVMHPHSLILLKDAPLEEEHVQIFHCSACKRECNGFTYKCEKDDCYFSIDVHCASVSEPLDHQCHPHPLFLRLLIPGTRRICSICQGKFIGENLDCGDCDFALCFRCATLPKKFMYKHDEHPLIFSYEHEESGEYSCDVCEKEIYPKNGVYMCSFCDIALHIECLLGKDMFMLPGKEIIQYGTKSYILPNNHLTRPICKTCNKRCQNKRVYKTPDEALYCSYVCVP